MSERFKVLVSDAISDSGLAPLQGDPHIDVDVLTGLSQDKLIEIIPAYDALLVRSATKVTAPILQAGKRLRVVARAGVGVDNIDLEAATQAGVIVVNAPTGNVVAAAEHTVAMLMAVARNIPQADAHLRAGLWKRDKFMGVEIRDKVLGTVGLGRVAQEVVRRCQGLGMQIMAHDPYVTNDYATSMGVTLVDLETLLAQADFVTLHTPLTAQTKNLINAERLARMKPEARIINVARGGVIDEHALVAAINAGQLAGAALDVFENEPLEADSPLRGCTKIVLTPHLGGSTQEAQEKVAEDVALQVLDVLHDKPARYAVNAPIIPPKDLEFLVPYIELAEQMGRMIAQLGAQGMGDVEIAAHGSLAGFNLSYVRAALIKGMLADVTSVRINLVNAALVAERRGMNLRETRRHHSDSPYENMLSLSATSGSQRWTVHGSVVRGVPHIVGIDDFWVDFPATGHILLAMHQDSPGMIGRVGTLLGSHDINISFMHVGRRAPRGAAIMALGTDESTPEAIQERITSMERIFWLKAITL
jgi:D-3-phosphoglycerate dehydrogenase